MADNEQLHTIIDLLSAILEELRKPAAPPPPATAPAFALTPDGLPICPKHAAPMTPREKQGDLWHSHAISADGGERTYCRGYATKNGPGWWVQNELSQITPAPAPAPTKNDTTIFTYCYADGTEALAHPGTRAAFNEYRRAHNERVPASREALSAWHRQQQKQAKAIVDTINAELFG